MRRCAQAQRQRLCGIERVLQREHVEKLVGCDKSLSSKRKGKGGVPGKGEGRRMIPGIPEELKTGIFLRRQGLGCFHRKTLRPQPGAAKPVIAGPFPYLFIAAGPQERGQEIRIALQSVPVANQQIPYGLLRVQPGIVVLPDQVAHIAVHTARVQPAHISIQPDELCLRDKGKLPGVFP